MFIFFNKLHFISTEFKITVNIDENYQRTKETVVELKYSNSTSDTCLSAEVNISVAIDIYMHVRVNLQ